MNRTYGWRPDMPDHRDAIYSSVLHAGVLPPTADLRAGFPACYDQGNLGSCTGNALAGAIAFENHRVGMPSRLFIYYGERSIEGTIGQDAGAQIRDGIKVLAKTGVCSEAEWPYVIAKFKTKPSAQCFADALPNRIISYQRVVSLQDMKAALASGSPVVFGFTVYESFESDAVAKTGMVQMPGKTERALGGHAVVGVGYNDASQRIIVRNSWGTAWGMHGYFTLPYVYIQNRNLSDDFWTIRR